MTTDSLFTKIKEIQGVRFWKSFGKGPLLGFTLATIALLVCPSLVTATEAPEQAAMAIGLDVAPQLGAEETISQVSNPDGCNPTGALAQEFQTFDTMLQELAAGEGGGLRGDNRKVWNRDASNAEGGCSCSGYCWPTCHIVTCTGTPFCCRQCEVTGCYQNCPPTGGGGVDPE